MMWPWLVWLSGLRAGLQTKGFPVRFPVRATSLLLILTSWEQLYQDGETPSPGFTDEETEAQRCCDLSKVIPWGGSRASLQATCSLTCGSVHPEWEAAGTALAWYTAQPPN